MDKFFEDLPEEEQQKLIEEHKAMWDNIILKDLKDNLAKKIKSDDIKSNTDSRIETIIKDGVETIMDTEPGLLPIKDMLIDELRKAITSPEEYLKSEETKLEVFEVPDANAYWISPGGQLFEVEKNHIDEIIKSPKSFGLTKEYVDAMYKKYNEPMGFEGKARHEIMEALIRGGWIRIRYYVEEAFYVIELNKLTKKVKDYLWAWANGVVKANSKRKFSDVKITEFAMGNISHRRDIDKITKDELYNSKEKKAVREKLVVLESVYDVLSIHQYQKLENSEK
ncbi:MAG: hypothetical protein FWE72_00755 [Spirochaetaceae bacterium]|nr:hypothetical protein [Spirochaetaceae bacterium]